MKKFLAVWSLTMLLIGAILTAPTTPAMAQMAASSSSDSGWTTEVMDIKVIDINKRNTSFRLLSTETAEDAILNSLNIPVTDSTNGVVYQQIIGGGQDVMQCVIYLLAVAVIIVGGVIIYVKVKKVCANIERNRTNIVADDDPFTGFKYPQQTDAPFGQPRASLVMDFTDTNMLTGIFVGYDPVHPNYIMLMSTIYSASTLNSTNWIKEGSFVVWFTWDTNAPCDAHFWLYDANDVVTYHFRTNSMPDGVIYGGRLIGGVGDNQRYFRLECPTNFAETNIIQ